MKNEKRLTPVNGKSIILRVPESISSHTTNQSDFSKKSDFLAQSIRLVPKSVVLMGGMK
jgi:hypothetical protein